MGAIFLAKNQLKDVTGSFFICEIGHVPDKIESSPVASTLLSSERGVGQQNTKLLGRLYQLIILPCILYFLCHCENFKDIYAIAGQSGLPII